MSRRKKPGGKYQFKFPRTSHEWCQEYLRKLDEQPKNELYEARQREEATLRQAQGGRPGNLMPGDLRSLSASDRSNADLITLIKQSWEKIKPILSRDSDELNRRLARRRNGMMNRPPRAWCLAVRAADSRITPATARIVPEDAAYPKSHHLGVEHSYGPHEVTLDAELLRKLCAPVYCDWPYSEVPDLMRRLGCSLHNIRHAIKAGVFRVEKIQNLGGKWGWPVPVLYTDRPLDPGSRLRERADPVWGTMSGGITESIPDDLEQTIKRVPSSVYVPPGPGHYMRGDTFTGWKWICPSCRKTCRTIFYPLPPLCWVQLLEKEFHDTDPSHPDALAKGNQTFACMTCHNVLYFSRLSGTTWNHLIAHLSAGLLYGSEVPRPAWYAAKRKRAFHPILRREPSKRREQVLEMLMQGMGVTQIALELRLSKSAVGTYASHIYRQKGVKSQKELLKKEKRVGNEANADTENVSIAVD